MGVAELAEDHVVGLITCEGGGDVVGVITHLVGGEAQAFHDDQVVELRVQLGVQEVEGKDREEQVGVAVEVSCTTPHIYEQKTAQTMATSWTCLSTTR